MHREPSPDRQVRKLEAQKRELEEALLRHAVVIKRLREERDDLAFALDAALQELADIALTGTPR